jgi:hypothetical protein
MGSILSRLKHKTVGKVGAKHHQSQTQQAQKLQRGALQLLGLLNQIISSLFPHFLC